MTTIALPALPYHARVARGVVQRSNDEDFLSSIADDIADDRPEKKWVDQEWEKVKKKIKKKMKTKIKKTGKEN